MKISKIFYIFFVVTMCLIPARQVNAEEQIVEGVCGNELSDSGKDNSYGTTSTEEVLLITEDLLDDSSRKELIGMIQNFTGWEKEKTEQYIDTLLVQPRQIQPRIYQMQQITEWYEGPTIIKTENCVSASSEWIGIDAYRSSVGMSKGAEESISVSVSLGFGGDQIIADTLDLDARVTVTQVATVSATQVCPEWTTMNWRPYIVYKKDYYTGIRTTYIKTINLATGDYTISDQTYRDVKGTDTQLLVKATEVWSRVNEAKDIYAATPLPPSDPPEVN